MKNMMQEDKVQHYSAIYFFFLLISMVELDHRRSAVKTLVNKMGLNT